VAIFYADASALVKLVREETESGALRTFLAGADLVSSELILTEVPRAVHRVVAQDPELSRDLLLERVAQLVDAVALLPVDRALLVGAGAIADSALRSLDAIHIASAAAAGPVDAFVTYDERLAAVARLAGFRTMAPGRA
jgi:predicted nucleic acid-binding protein